MRDFYEIVRERAYELWEKSGRPDGRSLEFWFAAKYEVESSAAPGMKGHQVSEQGTRDEGAEERATPSAPESGAD